MNDDTITDLKQFITTTVSQQGSELRDEIREDTRNEIKKLDDKLSKKIDDLSAAVGEAIDVGNEAIETQVQDHEKRLTRLERRAS